VFKRLKWQFHQSIDSNGKWSPSTPREAEAWALHQAINWTHELGMHNVIFELDCKLVVDNMVKNIKGSTDFHAILNRFRASFVISQRVSFVKRHANLVAYNSIRIKILC